MPAHSTKNTVESNHALQQCGEPSANANLAPGHKLEVSSLNVLVGWRLHGERRMHHEQLSCTAARADTLVSDIACYQARRARRYGKWQLHPDGSMHGYTMGRRHHAAASQSMHVNNMLAQSSREVVEGQMQQLTDSSTCLKTAS